MKVQAVVTVDVRLYGVGRVQAKQDEVIELDAGIVEAVNSMCTPPNKVFVDPTEKDAPDNTPDLSDVDFDKVGEMKYNDLKKLAAHLGLDIKGKQAELVERILSVKPAQDDENGSDDDDEPEQNGGGTENGN